MLCSPHIASAGRIASFLGVLLQNFLSIRSPSKVDLGVWGPRSSSSCSCTCICITNNFFSLTDTAASASAILLQHKVDLGQLFAPNTFRWSFPSHIYRCNRVLDTAGKSLLAVIA
jgi:hypothetical protein